MRVGSGRRCGARRPAARRCCATSSRPPRGSASRRRGRVVGDPVERRGEERELVVEPGVGVVAELGVAETAPGDQLAPPVAAHGSVDRDASPSAVTLTTSACQVLASGNIWKANSLWSDQCPRTTSASCRTTTAATATRRPITLPRPSMAVTLPRRENHDAASPSGSVHTLPSTVGPGVTAFPRLGRVRATRAGTRLEEACCPRQP